MRAPGTRWSLCRAKIAQCGALSCSFSAMVTPAPSPPIPPQAHTNNAAGGQGLRPVDLGENLRDGKSPHHDRDEVCALRSMRKLRTQSVPDPAAMCGERRSRTGRRPGQGVASSAKTPRSPLAVWESDAHGRARTQRATARPRGHEYSSCMPQGRPHIPAQLEREVKMEAGYRCAIPTCRQHPIETAHIVPWPQVKEHKFSNLIALCANCHTRYDRGEIDRSAMRGFKANLGIINARYGEYERRLLEFFATRHRVNLKTFKIAEGAGGAAALAGRLAAPAEPAQADHVRDTLKWFFENGIPHIIALPGGPEFLVSRLILDGCLVKLPPDEIGVMLPGGLPLIETYALTELGVELVERLIAAEPLDP
jgi:hypothetical protein